MIKKTETRNNINIFVQKQGSDNAIKPRNRNNKARIARRYHQ